jgi:GTP-binding protein YchF
MPLQLGLVGLPNVGKSTLFNALTRAGALVAAYPFTTIEPNIGIAPVPDMRLDALARLIGPEKVVPATLRVVDIAGLVRGASRGEGLGNEFLSHIRAVDAIAMVVRCFPDEQVPHVTPDLRPIEDMETIDLELALADLQVLERHLERVQGRAKANPREFAAELGTVEAAIAGLREGTPLRRQGLSEEAREHLREAAVLTSKPMLYVANVAEDDLPAGGPNADAVRAYAAQEGAEVIVLSAQTESEIADWPPDEARAYLADLGLEEPGLARFVRAGYRLLDQISFFTTTGGKEVRAWTLRRGETALEAAGQIHTDMQRGFIRAEVIGWEALVEAGSYAHAREVGRLTVEGRDYVVQDGDVLHIRFAV